MDIFSKLAENIIKEQENIIGPVALEQAQKVPGMKIDWPNHKVLIEGNQTEIIEKLIEKYQHLFGQASVEICREAVESILSQVPKDRIPKLLQ